MTGQRTASMVVAALLLGLLAGPAAADKVKDKDGIAIANNMKDAGTVTGTADVGKFRTGCLTDGTSTVSGPGLGTPLQATKNAYYALDAPGGVTSLFKPIGTLGDLKVCGRLTKMHSAVAGGTGAACGSSKGWDGKGMIVFPGKPTLWLDDLGWKVSVSAFIVTADVAQGSPTYAQQKFAPATRNVQDQLVAEIQASGASACFTKVGTPSKQGGATRFDIIGSYQILQGEKVDRNLGPECKGGLAVGCVNDPKKPGASG